MNNIKQKNVILKLKNTANLPYRSAEYVNQFSECNNITHIDVNNSMRQLLENDLYIENTLNSTSSYIIGPKTDKNLDDKPDGYKTYSNLTTSDTLEILHKVDKQLSSTIEKVQSGASLFTTEWLGLVFIGRAGCALQYSTDTTLSALKEFPITATNFYQDDKRILFSASDGIYQLSSYIEDDEYSENYGKTLYGVVRLNSNDISELQSVHFNENTQKVIAGGQTCLYEGLYDSKKSLDELKLNIKFESQALFDEDGDIVSEAVSALGSDGRITIAGTKSGIFQPGSSTAFKDGQSLNQYSGGEIVSKAYSVIAEFDGNIYVGAENGLFKVNGNILTLAELTGGNITVNVSDIKVKNDTMYVATESCIYSVNKQLIRSADYLSLALPNNRIASSAVIRRIVVDNNQVYIATSDGLYCFTPADVVYINEVCSNGQTRPLPVTDTSNRITDARDVCIKDQSMIIGTSQGIFRLELTGLTKDQTKIVKDILQYSDQYGQSISESILKILQDDRLDGAYIVTQTGISHTSQLERKWITPISGEQINDAAIAEIDGTIRLLVTTTNNTYILQLGYGPSIIARPSVDIPGVSVAANSNIIIVAGSDGKCRYIYNSLEKFKNGSFLELQCGIDKFQYFDGAIYGIRTDNGASGFLASSQPSLNNAYANYTTKSYSWSDVQLGYLFIRNGKLIFKGFKQDPLYPDPVSEDTEVEVSITVLDDVDSWYSGSDATFIYVDNIRNIAYLGTSSGLLQANLADSSGQKIDVPVFENCICQAGYTFGSINCISRGYTANGDQYSYGNYTILTPGSDGCIEKNVEVEEHWSILVAAQNGLFELKCDGTQFNLISDTVYKAISSTPKLFIGVTSDNKVHTSSSVFSETSVEVPISEGIKPETENSPVTYTKYTMISPFQVREHTVSAPSDTCFVKVLDTGSNHVMYMAGGVASVIKNTIQNGNLTTFQFSASQYGYVQSSVDIKCIQPPEDKQSVVYCRYKRSKQDTYYTSSGTMESRTVTYYIDLSYDPMCELLFGFMDGYSDYVIYAANGIYTVDNTNIVVTEQPLVAASGLNISNAIGFCSVPGKLYIICRNGEGIQTVDNSFTRISFVVEDMCYADCNFYFKTDAEWRYMTESQFLATDQSATADQAVSLKYVFSQAGIPESDAASVKADIDKTVYVGTHSAGLMQISYFINEVQTFSVADVPSIFEGFYIYSLNPSLRSDDIMTVKLVDTDKYEIFDYNLVTNTASIQEYQIEQRNSETGTTGLQTITQFGKAVFSNKDGSDVLYVADSYGNLYYTSTLTFKESPDVGTETFYDITYIFRGTNTLMARNGSVFRFAEIGASTAWTRLADTGSVNSMLDISGGKCLITTSNGLWYYDEIKQSEDVTDSETGKTITKVWYEGECVKLREVEGGIKAIHMYVYDGKECYLYTSGKNMLSSANYKLWKPVLTWDKTSSGESTQINVINGVHRFNDNIYFAAADTGTYMTKYSYEMIYDIKSFTKDRALSIYDELFQDLISAEVCTLISNHISAANGDHSENAVITQINNHYLNVDLDNITNWSSATLCNDTDGYIDIKNDIINDMYFGECGDSNVAVNISSYLTPQGSVQQDNISYITKRWSSGITELYINVPTISSYYIANCFGASNCQNDQSYAYSRKNLELFGSDLAIQDSIISTHYTALSVGIASSFYHIDNLLDIQINGMSLPLAIYKDQTVNGDSGIAGRMYRSYVEPSVIRKYDIKKTDDNGKYIFEFACFGTDAQAIKIMFYDSVHSAIVNSKSIG